MPEPKNRARLLILSHICQFSLGRRIGDQPYAGLHDMCFRETRAPELGALVALSSAAPSKWYLSWVHSFRRPEGYADIVYTLESIEDGELCDWSNVSLWQYDTRQTANHPEWRWTDAQHELNDRWLRLCHKERDAYIYLPVQAEFARDGDTVRLMTRTRFGLDDHTPSKWFDDWRAVTDEMMLEFYDAAVAEAKQKNEAARAEKQAAEDARLDPEYGPRTNQSR